MDFDYDQVLVVKSENGCNVQLLNQVTSEG